MIRGFIARHGYAPTTREIQESFGFASQTAAVNHLAALVRQGAITMAPGRARTIVLRDDPRQSALAA